MIRFLCTSCLVVFTVTGCSDPAARFSGGSAKYPTWVALEKLSAEDLQRAIEMPALEEDWNGVKAGVTSSDFKAALEEFANAPIPAEFASADRKSAKDEAVKHYRALIEAAENNAPADEIKAAYEAAAKSMEAVRKPAGAQAD